MKPFFADCFDRLGTLHAEIEKAIVGLPQEALDWSPGPGMNSMAVLVVHTAGAERYWIGDVIGQDDSGRVRDEEFMTKGLDETALCGKLAAALEHSRGVLADLSVTDLDQPRRSARHGEDFTAGWALVHALEHTAVHTGHIQLMRQLWDQSQQ
jgi:uncharacterized damage-inducible protein DinB